MTENELRQKACACARSWLGRRRRRKRRRNGSTVKSVSGTLTIKNTSFVE